MILCIVWNVWKLVDYLKLHERQYKWQRIWWPHHIRWQFGPSHIWTRQMLNNSIQCVTAAVNLARESVRAMHQLRIRILMSALLISGSYASSLPDRCLCFWWFSSVFLFACLPGSNLAFSWPFYLVCSPVNSVCFLPGLDCVCPQLFYPAGSRWILTIVCSWQ